MAARFAMPRLQRRPPRTMEPDLPYELESLDQLVNDPTEDLDAQRKKDLETVEWIGRGALPEEFKKLYAFREDRYVETWKLVPWADAERIWFVVRTAEPVKIDQSMPRLRFNGRELPLTPRVDYRDWICPIFFADVTDAVIEGKNNTVELFGLANREAPAVCALESGSGRVPE